MVSAGLELRITRCQAQFPNHSAMPPSLWVEEAIMASVFQFNWFQSVFKHCSVYYNNFGTKQIKIKVITRISASGKNCFEYLVIRRDSSSLRREFQSCRMLNSLFVFPNSYQSYKNTDYWLIVLTLPSVALTVLEIISAITKLVFAKHKKSFQYNSANWVLTGKKLICAVLKITMLSTDESPNIFEFSSLVFCLLPKWRIQMHFRYHHLTIII